MNSPSATSTARSTPLKSKPKAKRRRPLGGRQTSRFAPSPFIGPPNPQPIVHVPLPASS
ncbi:hypothetical protein [Actomonas aquatica]|uniref:Uncharacterized protein n=1 Tax=Actomonas aquatica TaxID=2866162 RepID=A0ABZ1C3T2_9BACT|nr:hypothetical protein [Opitutus sp. WL0086]WRQ86030.1 hypothetical protein K1X11_014545 [Opitutus sp. WL0086]